MSELRGAPLSCPVRCDQPAQSSLYPLHANVKQVIRHVKHFSQHYLGHFKKFPLVFRPLFQLIQSPISCTTVSIVLLPEGKVL